MRTREAHGCEVCRKGGSGVLRQMGPGEYNEYGGGKAREIVTSYECTQCGAQWENIKESGLGGKGYFWHPRDPRE